MDQRTKVIELVKSIMPTVGDPEGIAVYERESADFALPRLSLVTAPPESVARLTSELFKFHAIAELEGGLIHNSPTSTSSPLRVESLAQWLLAQSRFRAPEECLEELLDTIARNNSTILDIVPIWGISPRVSFNLEGGVSVVPIADLPSSRLKDLMMGKKRHAFSFDVANSFPKPGAAIVKQTVHGPLFEGPGSKNAQKIAQRSQLVLATVMAPTEELKQEALKELAKMMTPAKSPSVASIAQELCEVIALLVAKPIFVLGQWYQRPPNTPLSGNLSGYSGPTNDHPFYLAVEPQDYPIGEIQELVRRYQALNQSVRKRLRTPLARLNQGRRHLEHTSVDAAAIDLGISTESLLTQERDSDAPISFVLRARGTLLLGGTAEQRKQNYKILRDLYDLRSKVAHEGSVPGNAQEAMEKAKSGQRACTDLIKTIIDQGRFPDWDQLMFGW